MNSLTASIVIACAVALLVTLTRPKEPQQYNYAPSETNMTTFLRVLIITFVCSYFGMTYFLAPACPDIIQGEPDF